LFAHQPLAKSYIEKAQSEAANSLAAYGEGAFNHNKAQLVSLAVFGSVGRDHNFGPLLRHIKIF